MSFLINYGAYNALFNVYGNGGRFLHRFLTGLIFALFFRWARDWNNFYDDAELKGVGCARLFILRMFDRLRRMVFTSVITYGGSSKSILFYFRPLRAVKWDFCCNAYSRVTSASAYCSCCFTIITRGLNDDFRIDRVFNYCEQ